MQGGHGGFDSEADSDDGAAAGNASGAFAPAKAGNDSKRTGAVDAAAAARARADVELLAMDDEKLLEAAGPALPTGAATDAAGAALPCFYVSVIEHACVPCLPRTWAAVTGPHADCGDRPRQFAWVFAVRAMRVCHACVPCGAVLSMP